MIEIWKVVKRHGDIWRRRTTGVELQSELHHDVWKNRPHEVEMPQKFYDG